MSSKKNTARKPSISEHTNQKDIKQLQNDLAKLDEVIKEKAANANAIDIVIAKLIADLYDSLHQNKYDRHISASVLPKWESLRSQRNSVNEEINKLLKEFQSLAHKIGVEIVAEAQRGKIVEISANTSQILASTLTSVDDIRKVDFSHKIKFKESEIEKLYPPVGKSNCAEIFSAIYEDLFVTAKVLKDSVSDEEVKYLRQNFENLVLIRIGSLLSYIAISEESEQHTVILTERSKGPINSIDPSTGFYIIHNFPLERKIKIARGLAIALNYLHTLPAPIIHARIKPSNVLLTIDNKVRLADYGLLFRLSDEQIINGGYMPYMAPELFGSGSSKFVRNHTFASDIYAFGMTLYFLFTEKIPFENKSYEEIKLQSQNSDNEVVKYMSEKLPETLQRLIKGCIHPDPNSRTLIGFFSESNLMNVIEEYFRGAQGDAMKVWPNPKISSMPWIEFKKNWEYQFKMLTPVQEEYLKTFLGVPLDPCKIFEFNKEGKRISYTLKEHMVSKFDFDTFLTLFGPLSKETVDKRWHKLQELVKASWYYGRVASINDANIILSSLKPEENSVPYMVIYLKNESSPLYFVFLKDGKFKSQNFNLDFSSQESLQKQIEGNIEKEKKKSKQKHELVAANVRDPVFRRINPIREKNFINTVLQTFHILPPENKAATDAGYTVQTKITSQDDEVDY